jgi:hypothetical protein
LIDFDLLCKIAEYAKGHCETSYLLYQGRGAKKDKIFINCLNGKIAEYCLYFYLKKQNYQLKPPDINIHTNKSYDSDLIATGKNNVILENPINLHVKSMSLEAISRTGRSVVFQKNDPIIIKPNKNDFIVLMEQVSFLEYKIHRMINSTDAEYLPTMNNAPSKCAIYAD